MTLAELMRRQFATATRDESVDAAWARVEAAGVAYLFVMDKGHLTGFAGRFDLQRARRRRQGRAAVGEVAIHLPAHGRPEMTAREAARLLEEHHLACLPVVRAGRPLGYVVGSDLVPGLLRRPPRLPRVKPVKQSGRNPRAPLS